MQLLKQLRIGLRCEEPKYSSLYAICRIERFNRPAEGEDGRRPSWKRLRREEIHAAIQRGDDFTARQQLLQIIAPAQLFVLKKAEPKIGPRKVGLP